MVDTWPSVRTIKTGEIVLVYVDCFNKHRCYCFPFKLFLFDAKQVEDEHDEGNTKHLFT
jgi:hypothetical protein